MGLRERESELWLLRERVAELRGHSGCVVVIEGRAGAGKTALLQAGVAIARAAGHDVRVARSREHERPAWGATLRRLGLADAHDVAAAACEVAGLGQDEPVVVAVDDLHLADAQSIATLLEIAHRVEDRAMLLMVALRRGEWPADDARLDDLCGSVCTLVLRPSPLSSPGVAAVLKDHGGMAVASAAVAEQQAEWTAGNPFLVEAVARSGCDIGVIPDDVIAIVSRQLAHLSAGEAALARALSILGSGAPLRRVARLAELDRASAERAADRLARVGLLRPGDPLCFYAPIEGAAIAEAIEPFARARAHRSAATVLLDEAAESVQIADHLLVTSAAGDPEVFAVLQAAAEQAIVDGQPHRAARYLDRALDEPPPAKARDETLLALVNAEALCGKPSSMERLERALDRVADGRSRSQALRQLGGLLFLRNQPDRAAATLLRGLDHVGDDEHLREALLGEYLAAATFAPSLRADAGARFGKVMEAIAAGGPLPKDPGLLVQVANAMAIGGAPRAGVLQIVDELLRVNPTWDGPPFGLFADWVTSACICVDELALAERVSKRSHEAARDAGDVVRQCLTSYWLGVSHLHHGHLDDAVSRFDAALRRQDAGWTSAVPWAAAALCVAELECGRPEDAARAVGIAEGGDPDGFHTVVVHEARGHIAMAAGEPTIALDHYEASGKLAAAFGIDAPTMITWRSNAAFAIRASGGDLQRARTLAEEELARAQSIGGPRQIARAIRASAAASPDAAAAVRLLRDAQAITAAAGPRLEHLHVLADLGAALTTTGAPTAAREPLLELLDLAQRAGAGALAMRARTLLRATGMRPRRTARSGVGTLTAAELRVAELAARGRQNPAIADLLMISERTVETHLYNTFRKLGIHRREELARHLP